MRKYSRVSYEIRCQIDALLQAKFNIPEIASKLGYHKTTIYRELKRNHTYAGTYTPISATRIAAERYRRCRKKYLMRGDLLNLVTAKLKEGWSPEQISGRLKRERIRAPSHTCIYNFIYGDRCRERRLLYRKDLASFLRRHGKRGAGRYVQRRRAKSNGIPIQNRPQIANDRRRIGDWERDTMHTLNGIQMLVCTDRKSRLTKIARVDVRTTAAINQLTLKLLLETNKKIYTITNDNGGDFKGKDRLPIKTYFCTPMKPQQRGTVENTIGLLRQYISTKTDIGGWDDSKIKEYEEKINLRPRKVLDYQTPYEVYFKNKVALASLI